MGRRRKRNTRRRRRAGQIKVKTPPFQNTDLNLTLIDQIPQDVVGEILSLLPVKSLLRFRCVSKSWLSLISSPDFVKTHLQRSSKNVTHTHHRVLLNKVETFLEGFSLNSFLNNNLVVHSIVIPWGHFYVVDSCNGLFCISSRDGNDLFLWNPSTRKYRKLPDSGEEIKTSWNRYGFGFDESVNDYKIVKLGLAFLNSLTYPDFSVVISVYSRKTDSWKRIEDFPGRSEDIDNEQKFVNGKMHWLTQYSPHTQRRNIVSLDLQKEVYESIQLPFPDNIDIDVRLGSLGGCLSMLGSCSNQWNLWILKEYGVKEPWTHVVNIHSSDIYSFYWRSPLSYMLNDCQILFVCGSIFILYNPKDQSWRTRDAGHSSCCYEYRGVDIYVESLVSPSVDDHGPGFQPK